MKAYSVPAALTATVIQISSFIGLWAVAFYMAKSLGRIGHSDFGFGITITYGAFLIGFLCLISSVIATLTLKNELRWMTVGIATVAWSFWMFPAFDSHPFRAPVYFSIGCVVLIAGSIHLAPSIMKGLQARYTTINTKGDQVDGGQ